MPLKLPLPPGSPLQSSALPWGCLSPPGSHRVAKPSGQCCVPSSLSCSASPDATGHALPVQILSPCLPGPHPPPPPAGWLLLLSSLDRSFLISLPSSVGMPQASAPRPPLSSIYSVPPVLAGRHSALSPLYALMVSMFLSPAWTFFPPTPGSPPSPCWLMCTSNLTSSGQDLIQTLFLQPTSSRVPILLVHEARNLGITLHSFLSP